MSNHQLSGNLQETPFAEVAGALYREKRSGALTLSSGERARTVIFHEGSPVAVISADPRDHVAALLTAKGKIGPEEAERLKALPETKEALQSADFIGQDVLMWGLKFRFVNLCYDFFRWVDGEYSFEEGAPPKGIFLMKVPTPTLLAKGVKHMPPSLLMERIASGLEVAPGAAGTEAAGALGEEEKALALLCTEGRTVQDVHEAGGTDPVRAREILYTLKALDIISLHPPAPAGEAAPEIAEELVLEDEAPVELAGPGSGGEAEAPQPEAEPAFEIERHSYEEEAQPPPSLAEEGAEPVPPVEQDLQEGLKQVDAGIDESAGGALPELETPGLDMPPPPVGDGEVAPETSPELETPGLDIPSPDGDSPELAPIGFDEPAPAAGGELEPPGEEIPPPSADLPPPPWQEEPPAGPGELGSPDSGAGSSPFAPPPTGDEAPGEPSPPPRKDRARKPAKAQKERSLFSKLLIGVVMAVAAVVIASGLWMGSASLRSPSVPLPPIPPAEEVEMADGLPVPALPKGLPAPAESDDPGEPAGRSPAGDEPAATETPSEPVREAAAPESPAEAPPGQTPHEAAIARFEAGDHLEAAETWRTMASESGGAWTIQVVVACQVDTVAASFERFGSERELFALPLQLSGRSCFRVCYGLFGTRGQAQAALEALPAPLQYELSVRGLKGLL